MKTFEKNLTFEEEKHYFELFGKGDLEARDKLILHNMRLVAHVVKKYGSCERDIQDMISIGTIGLIKAINTFDYTKGARFSTYGAKCIDNEILMMLRNEKKLLREVSIYEPIGTDKEGNEINLLDVIVSDKKDFTEEINLKDDIKKLHNAIDVVLKPREKDIIYRRYGMCGYREQTQKDIAKELNISRSYVSRIEKKALEKLLHFLMCCDKF